MRDGNVTEQGFVLGGDYGEVGVVALECGNEGMGDGRGRRGGKGWWWVEIFYCCLLGELIKYSDVDGGLGGTYTAVLECPLGHLLLWSQPNLL